ncbi:dehydrogenase/reductase SDR family member 4-like isoform X2 [Melopsittacus undulatus]|uniref:dehydrogenase/reductase SDR family member 4-like isoform X2 n=1 Tax=Melopsittacus undulatus TaxID=13146 RepID=UPI00146A2B7E|nr:dehydrogenase/reductase SDR family member 4-like isoform X2 [Melopsittacus undulatus]
MALMGKVAAVTAATDGIGLAVAAALGGAGAHVVLSSRRADHVDAAVGRLRALGLEHVTGCVCHVGRARDRQALVQKALDTYGGIDILVSNAATNPVMGNTLDAEEEAWEKIFQVNVTAAAMLIRLVVPHMEKRGGGSIVLVSSLAGYMPFPVLGPELLPHRIRINGVAPGLIQTRFSRALWEDESVRTRVMSSMGIDRMGTPDDVAGVVTFLCSPAAAYVTGETLVVAGGAPSRL